MRFIPLIPLMADWRAHAAGAEPDDTFHQAIHPCHTLDDKENEALVKLFDGMRVTDVVDGLDVVGLQDVRSWIRQSAVVERREDVHPPHLWSAVTLPSSARERAPNFASHEGVAKWEGRWYGEKNPLISPKWFKPGTILVIDACGPRTSDSAARTTPCVVHPGACAES